MRSSRASAVTKLHSANPGGKTGLDQPGDVMPTLEEVMRRRRARAVGLELSASIEEIQRAENLRAGRNPTTRGGNAVFEWETPAPAASGPQIIAELEEIPLEKDVQREVRQLYIDAGCEVFWMSQARKSGQTPGIPDLWLFHERAGIAFWHECKRPGQDLTEVQQHFRKLCELTGIRHVSGGVVAAKQAIDWWGLR